MSKRDNDDMEPNDSDDDAGGGGGGPMQGRFTCTRDNVVRMIKLSSGFPQTVRSYNEGSDPVEWLRGFNHAVLSKAHTAADALTVVEAMRYCRGTAAVMEARDRRDHCALAIHVVHRLLWLGSDAAPAMIEHMLISGCLLSLKSALIATENVLEVLEILKMLYVGASAPNQTTVVVSQTEAVLHALLDRVATGGTFRELALLVNTALTYSDHDLKDVVECLCRVFHENIADACVASRVVFMCCEHVENYEMALHVVKAANDYVDVLSGRVLLDAARSVASIEVTDEVVAAGLVLLRHSNPGSRWPEVTACLPPTQEVVEAAMAVLDERGEVGHWVQASVVVSIVAVNTPDLSAAMKRRAIALVHRYTEQQFVVPAEVLQGLTKWSLNGFYDEVATMVNASRWFQVQLYSSENGTLNLREMIEAAA